MKIWIQLVPVNLNTPFTNIPLQVTTERTPGRAIDLQQSKKDSF